jgi:hypothetical protein
VLFKTPDIHALRTQIASELENPSAVHSIDAPIKREDLELSRLARRPLSGSGLDAPDRDDPVRIWHSGIRLVR